MADIAVDAGLDQLALSGLLAPVFLMDLPPAHQHQGNAQERDHDPQIHPPQADILPQGVSTKDPLRQPDAEQPAQKAFSSIRDNI